MTTPPPKPGRIAGMDWQKERPGVIGIYTAAYTPTGRPLPHGPRPWTVIGHAIFRTFPTHHEALQYALKKAGQ